MKPLKEKISITIDSDILETLRILADDDDCSLSQYINIVLKTHIAEKAAHSNHKNTKSDGTKSGRTIIKRQLAIAAMRQIWYTVTGII